MTSFVCWNLLFKKMSCCINNLRINKFLTNQWFRLLVSFTQFGFPRILQIARFSVHWKVNGPCWKYAFDNEVRLRIYLRIKYKSISTRILCLIYDCISVFNVKCLALNHINLKSVKFYQVQSSCQNHCSFILIV